MTPEAVLAQPFTLPHGQVIKNRLFKSAMSEALSDRSCQANPELAHSCRKAAEALSRVQVEYLDTITDEIRENSEDMMEGEFMLNEFVDRFGPRLAHLNGVIQVLAQLSSVPPENNSLQR